MPTNGNRHEQNKSSSSNLFELKHNQNKYSQLIEAQSPEPPTQTGEGYTNESVTTTTSTIITTSAQHEHEQTDNNNLDGVNSSSSAACKLLSLQSGRRETNTNSEKQPTTSSQQANDKRQQQFFKSSNNKPSASRRGNISQHKHQPQSNNTNKNRINTRAPAEMVMKENNSPQTTNHHQHSNNIQPSSITDGNTNSSSSRLTGKMELSGPVAARKASRCSSVLSTSQNLSSSFVSTLSLSQLNRSSSMVDFDPHATSTRNTAHQHAMMNEEDQFETNLTTTRTISQSMLNLERDPSRLSQFEVSWNELSFSYRPSLFANFKLLLASGSGLGRRFLSAAGNNNNQARRLLPAPVLCDLSGSFHSNQLVAVIGPSGCGKTTLLQFLAGNNQSNEDKLRISGLLEPKVAFIGQGDCLLPGLTARETLYYASRLQNTRPDFNHEAHIEPILAALGLSECADRNVTKLSGGQAKRVSIGQELLYPTNLLILDEVTSGLDASTSYSIVRLLKQLVSEGDYPMSIVMSIHQPSAKLFSVFDYVYVMSEGCCLYEGSCQIDLVNDYLSQFGLECPKYHNIADYLIEIASDDLTSKNVKEQMIKFQRNQQQQHTQPITTNPMASTNTSNVNGSNDRRNMIIMNSENKKNKKHDMLRLVGRSGRNLLVSDKNNKQNEPLHSSVADDYDNDNDNDDEVDDEYDEDEEEENNEDSERNGDDEKGAVATIIDTNPVHSKNGFNGDSMSRNNGVEKQQQQQHGSFFIEDEDEHEESHCQVALLMSNSLYSAIERARAGRKRSLVSHFLAHFNRSLLRIRRSYILTYLQLLTYILLGLQLSTFYGTGIGKLDGCPKLPVSFIAFVFSNDTDMESLNLEMRRIQENMNFLLVAIMTATFAALEITVITFPLEAKTVKREWRNGWYRVSSYFLGRTVADLPFQLSFVVVFCAIIYLMTGQIGGLATWRFASFVAIIIATALVAQAVGFIFGAIFMDNLPAAVFTAPLCIFPALLFSGFFSRVSQIPTFYKPMTYLSHFRYAFEALIVTLYGHERCQCDQSALNTYHENLHNQTSVIKTMLSSLFGSVDCDTTTTASTTNHPVSLGLATGGGGILDENSIEDTTANPLGRFLGGVVDAEGARVLNELTASSTSPTPLISNFTTSASNLSGTTSKALEDALVGSVFEHMVRSSGDQGVDDEHQGSAMDRLVRTFSSRVTTMLNTQANFGHQVPQDCQNFSSYLMTEFELTNDALIMGLFMLIISVLVTRLLCNTILTFTIATRSN